MTEICLQSVRDREEDAVGLIRGHVNMTLKMLNLQYLVGHNAGVGSLSTLANVYISVAGW